MNNCCPWVRTEADKLYHDQVWAVPLHDERELFKMLILEGQQAGLSWSIILNKIPAFESAYDHFDPKLIANYDTTKIEQLLNNRGIIRNKLKVNAAIVNAQAYLKLKAEFGSLNDYLWSFVNNQPIMNHFTDSSQIPASTPLSDKISADLKSRGFKFVGSTIIYAYMQAIGMVNDHLTSCYAYFG